LYNETTNAAFSCRLAALGFWRLAFRTRGGASIDGDGFQRDYPVKSVSGGDHYGVAPILAAGQIYCPHKELSI
jgi:hypothetical protein